jgi:hypothetical protein
MNPYKTYDKSDNDTYVEKLGITPYQDVHLHMFRDPNGFVVMDKIRGNFTADSIRVAENHVLQFPSPTDCAMVKIRDMRVPTFYPMSLVERYGLRADDLVYSQKLPIYFDPKAETYVLFMDTRFLRDMNFAELAPYLESTPFIKRIQQFCSTRSARSYLGIRFADLSEIKDAANFFSDESYVTPLSALHDAYVRYRLSLEHRDKVIIVQYQVAKGHASHLFDHQHQPAYGASVSTNAMSLEYAVAYRCSDRFNLADAQGEIIEGKVYLTAMSRWISWTICTLDWIRFITKSCRCSRRVTIRTPSLIESLHAHLSSVEHVN